MAHILLVEDNPHNQAVFQAALWRHGHRITVAADGEAALTFLRKGLPDLVLLDLSIPKIDGWTVARTIRAEEPDANLPILALTAHAMKGDRERAIEAGCDEYLSKPVSPRELGVTIKRLLSTTRSAA